MQKGSSLASHGGVRPSASKHSGERNSTSVKRNSRSRRTKQELSCRSNDLWQEVESAIHVLDNGVDRTPLPLQKRSNAKGVPRDSHQASTSISLLLPVESSSVFHSSLMNSSSMEALNLASNMSPYSPSHTGALTASTSLTSVSVDRRPSVFSSGSVSATGPLVPQHAGTLQMELEGIEAPQKPPLTREGTRKWFEDKTTIVLCETPTIMLYTHQDEIVPNERREEVRQVQQRNAAYTALVEAKRVDEGTRFQEKGAWTFLAPKKSIHCSICPPRKKNAGPLQVTPWMLRDQFAALTVDDADELEDEEDRDDEEDGELAEAAEEPEREAASEGASGAHSTRSNARSAVSWMLADSLLSTLRVMERVVVQNTMEEVQLSYRGITMDPAARRVPRPPEKEEIGNVDEHETAVSAEVQDAHETTAAAAATPAVKAELPPLRMSEDIKGLWTFRSPLTADRAVTCMAWNCKESDILAVGYSAVHAKEGQGVAHDPMLHGGIVCCWSLKNPLAPERVIRLSTEAGVSSVAFSYEHPSLLAVGNMEGGIVIYDIQKDTSTPAIKATSTSGQHTGAVWELKWVARGKERGEFLMSISGDGRVVQWAVGKTLERVAPDLMTLKRQHGAACESAFADDGSSAGKGNGNGQQRRKMDALFSRQCGGMCLDVSPADGTVYVVGSEDGSIHQCNKSQTETYELDYAPHSELVYRVRWSPYSDAFFLTCSADWSSRLYRLGQSAQLLTFDSPNQNAVQDVAWSFTNSTTFATVTAQGNVEMWSVTDSIRPRSTAQFLDQRRLASVLFAEQEAAVLVVGDEKGDVTVFRLLAPCYSNMNMTADEQEQQLEEAIRKAIS
ncbi:putative dynein intermediate chain [Trypanosoma conorhini]|uniref:Dynein axonemal intermediate chain 4 n=1 Tax=Trypanosoma conorhini TaxID=83891 RepID=A0A422PPS6_9TRYP|nr:putative dynein intermediate chain [Trypanosoma conorhini]RNF19712.1 putative dynein intermediate chain [Trypanosoma conorhini]